jgi:hypothetical protein
MKKLVSAALVAAAVAGVSAAESIDQAVIAKIKTEGFQHSSVMTTLSWLSDVYGPRLTGSTNLRRAGEWARDQLTRWGLQHAALETYPRPGRGWDLQRFSIEMIEPQYMRVAGYPKAWSPSTPSPIVGTPILVEVKGKEDFAKYKGKLRGAIVMNGRPKPSDIGFKPEAKRLTEEELTDQESQIDPAPEKNDNAPKSYWDEEDDFQKSLTEQAEVLKFFASEGIAALVTASEIPEAVRVGGFYDHIWHPTFPGFVFSREHYGRIMRMLDLKQPVKLSLSLTAQITDNVEGFNVVAEIPGVDTALKDQVVMLGGHFDSWHTGTGATDNGAGSAAAMEAVRILQQIGAKPRRTIRLALWTGEEQDYFGSLGYVQQHFGDVTTIALKPEHAKLAAYFNLDNGAGRIRGVNLQGNEAARPIFEEWLEPFHYLGATTVTTLNTGGTDHMPFDAVGLPGFQFIQDPLDYETRAHHTNLDVVEQVIPDDLKQASVIMASFVYNAAMRDEMIPRKALPKPHTKEKGSESH